MRVLPEPGAPGVRMDLGRFDGPGVAAFGGGGTGATGAGSVGW